MELKREIWLEKKDLKICPTIGKTVQGEQADKRRGLGQELDEY